MEVQTNRPVETLENVLLETRKTLESAYAAADELSRKHRGSQPSGECGERAPEEESLISVAIDLRRLARNIESELGTHHAFLGFDRKPPKPAMTGHASLR